MLRNVVVDLLLVRLRLLSDELEVLILRKVLVVYFGSGCVLEGVNEPGPEGCREP